MFRVLTPLTLFLSAFLLFAIQPMAGKALLPLFGGVSMVWVVCMLYFQCILLGAYSYAYLSHRYLTLKHQTLLHCLLLVLSFYQLPIGWGGMVAQDLTSPTLSLLTLLTSKLTFPLLMVCATAPLLQSWYAMTKEEGAKDPYFLYVASNLGSFAALLSYPFLIEKFFGLHFQSSLWSIGYLSFVLLIVSLAFLIKVRRKVETLESAPPVSVRQRVVWVYLSFIPVSLMLGVTTFITTDVASMPLLWVLPLALYLLTFIITFSKKPLLNHDFVKRHIHFVLIFLMVTFIVGRQYEVLVELVAIHLLAFFMIGLLCHGELIRLRPKVAHLNEFYLFIALGGVLGGIFNSLLAPLLFNNAYEYPIAILLGLSVLQIKKKHFNYKVPLIIAVLLTINAVAIKYYPGIMLISIKPYLPIGLSWLELTAIIPIICLVYAYLHVENSKQFILCLCLLFVYVFLTPSQQVIWEGRNFFGIKRVVKSNHYHYFINHTTIHGLERMDLGVKEHQTLSYYKPIYHIQKLLPFEKKRVAVVGLGVGVLSTQFDKKDEVYFYEIDSQILKLSLNNDYFTLLSNSDTKKHFVMGDARLNLAKEKKHYFDMIILDAFTSDAIPTHLITTEAINIYLDKLKKSGLLLFNISNKYLNFQPVLYDFAKHNHLPLFIYAGKYKHPGEFDSLWAVMSRDEGLINRFKKHKALRSYSGPSIRWTDDYSNILALLK